MTRQRSHRLAAEDGFTLTELLVAMTISTVVLLATLGTLDAFNSGVAANNRLTDAADASRRQVATMVSGLREAGTVQLPPSAPNDIVFQSTSWKVGRYCVDTANRKVWFNGLKAGTPGSATADQASCPSIPTGWTPPTLVASNVLNSAANPLFLYGSTNPVRSVSIRLLIDGGTALKPRTLVLRTGGAPRGALAPQVSAGDIVPDLAPCPGGEVRLSVNLAALPGAAGAKISAPNSIPAGPGQILVPATSTPVPVTITNVLGLSTTVTKPNVSC